MSDDDRPVLIITGIDTTADLVIARLNDRGVPVARMNLADLVEDATMTAHFGDPVRPVSGRLSTASRLVDLAQVRAVYWRRPTYPDYPGLAHQDTVFAQAHLKHGFVGTATALPNCLYVNHPRRALDAEYKPGQLATAARLGFTVPPTLITNDPEKARRFAHQHGPVVCKPLVWTDYHVKGHPHAVWVREVDPGLLDDSIRTCPHLFQQRVTKTADLRVTMVGNTVFAVRITSPLLDWRERYDAITDYTAVALPPDLVDQLRTYLDAYNLVYGCFDLGLDRDGETVWWYECNPAGEWAWIAAATDLPIADAFADVLETGTQP